MLDSKLLNKVNEVETQTGQSLPSLLSKVPLGNVLTAFKELQIADLVEMVNSVPISKLTHGLTIITPDEISQISPEKLKIVLKYGNMLTVENLQSKFGSRSIIIAINKLDENELKSLLEEDNFNVMSDVIEKLAFADTKRCLMQSNKPWTRQKLTQMLYHAFIGSLADNAIEIGWVLCFSLLANKGLVERITVLFGVNDAFWVVLSSTYYTARTSMTATLPKLIEKQGLSIESKVVKNHIYLFYLMLLPSAIGSFMFLPKLLLILGVSSADLPFYIPYFQLSIISILIAAPWATFIPSYLRTRGRSKEATVLDHSIAWSMLIGIFFTTHILHLGVNTALVVNMVTNAIPLYWFLWKKPIPHFFSKGFEFSWHEIKTYWKIVKWELIRRLAPRVSAIIGVGLTITINPIYAAIKYWISNLMMLPEGWVDSMAGLLNSHVSRNVGLNEPIPHKDNKYVFWKAAVGAVLSIALIYAIAYYGLSWLPESIYKGIISPIIWVLLPIEIVTKLRYYMWLAISRSYRHDLNGVAQMIYAIPTAILTPLLLWLFLHRLQLSFESIFAVGAIVGTIQWLGTEIYFRRNMKSFVLND